MPFNKTTDIVVLMCMEQKVAVEINVREMVQALGSPELIASLLKREGLANIDAPAIRQWINRNKIPGDRLIQLMVLSRRLKMSFNPLAYVVEGK